MNKVTYMGLLGLFFCQIGFSQGFIYATDAEDHLAKVTEWRKQKDADYKVKEKTMLTEELMKDFVGLKYYDVDYTYRVDGNLERFNDGRTFSINTTGGQVYNYLIYGKVSFELNGEALTLNVFQGKRAAKSGKKKGALFIPFMDLTSGETTYGGGRYLVLDVPDNDVLVLDFNMAYNPYCDYNPEHSCPIPPPENHLEVMVEAGELTYRSEKEEASFELVQFETEDGGKIEAAFFPAESEKGVIFAHGAIFNKESWYFLAEKFQSQNIAGLSIDFRGYGNSKAGETNKKLHDILGAITYLQQKGFKDINIIGGSMGGAAVLSALSSGTSVTVHKIVLLAPAGGPPVKSEKMDKLFIVSKKEAMYKRVKSVYDKSAEPKKIKEYPGNTHAQHLFKTDYAEALINLILDFIGSD